MRFAAALGAVACLTIANFARPVLAQPQTQAPPPTATPPAPPSTPPVTAVPDGTTTRAFHAFTSTGPRRFETSEEAQTVVDRIVRFVPLMHSLKAFVTDDAVDVPNAEARIGADDQRIIGFNRAFMRQIGDQAGNYWALVGIAAHEIGHHAGRHTFLPFDNCKLNNELELEADDFAGFALGKMDVKLDDAASTLRALPAPRSCTHPGREQRILVLSRGWTQASTDAAPEARAAGATAPKKAIANFRIRRNRDVYGSDLAKLPGLSQDGCAERCLKTDQCRGFSFDRWNGWCFLKSAMTASVLEPSSVIAVRTGDSFPAVAQTAFEMKRLRRKKFNDPPISTAPAASYEACEDQCQDRLDCVAYTHARKTNACQLFKETVGYFYDEGFESGYKLQNPQASDEGLVAGRVPGGGPAAGSGPGTRGDEPAPVSAAAPARIEFDQDRYFKGDGYAKHEDASIRDCEALCLRDRRCEAVEHIDKQKVCRLFARAEPALAADGTTVGYKRR